MRVNANIVEQTIAAHNKEGRGSVCERLEYDDHSVFLYFRKAYPADVAVFMTSCIALGLDIGRKQQQELDGQKTCDPTYDPHHDEFLESLPEANRLEKP